MPSVETQRISTPRPASAGHGVVTIAELWKRQACFRLASGLAGRLEHDGVDRLAGGLAGPQHELERLVVAFARLERGAERGLALRPRRPDAAGEQQGVAVHDQTVVEPQVEVADPELLVHAGDQLDHLVAPRRRNLELERTGE